MTPREIPVKLEGFEGRNVSVLPRGFFSFAPRIFLNGQPVARQGHGFHIADDFGQKIEFRIRYRFYDPIPDLEVAGKRVVLVSPLKIYQHLWICLPFLIFCFYGGILGGVCGLLAMHFNYVLFRSDHAPLTKYLLSSLFNISAGLFWFGMVFTFAHAFGIKIGLSKAAIDRTGRGPNVLVIGTIVGLIAIPALCLIEKLQSHFQKTDKKATLVNRGVGLFLALMILFFIALLIAVVCLCFIK